MDNKIAGKIVSLLWNDILIANWFDKEWFNTEFDTEFTEAEYKEIVRQWNNSNMFDYISELVRDWIVDNGLMNKVDEE